MTKIAKLQAGDRVIMSSTTRYDERESNPRGIEGVVTEQYNKDSYKVKWDNNTQNSGYKTPRDIELVQEKVTLDPDIEASIANLIMLEDVDKAHKKESDNWFKSLLSLVGRQTPIRIDTGGFFNEYEDMYKKKKDVTSMPTSYRTAKSVIMTGRKLDINIYGTGDTPSIPMGKTAIEKAIKESRKSKESVPLTNEELLGTIIKARDSIKYAYGKMTYNSEESKEAIEILKSIYIDITID